MISKYATTVILLTAIQLVSYTLGMKTYVYRDDNGILTRVAQSASPYACSNCQYRSSGNEQSIYRTDSRGVYSPYYSHDYISQATARVDSQGCSSNPCGTNAICREKLGRPVCSCPPGYSGSPTTICRRDECLDSTECPAHQACRNGVCTNPCAGACAVNANCDVRNHVAVCSCAKGYGGDPFTSCRLADPEEPCHPSPCGTNTKCEVRNGTPTCSCLPGYVGSALTGCRHECESDVECGGSQMCQNFKCVSACDQCGKQAVCSRSSNHRAVCECPTGYIGSPYSECRPECYGDVDCPAGRPACFYGICKNPCDGACGTNADCNLRGLTPVCSCPKTHTGNPFISCRPFTKDDLCNPNPCGQNAQCVPGHDNTGRERPVCTCLPGYTGDSLSACVRGECLSNEECGDNRACVGYTCVNPCVGECGAGAVCNVQRHKASCSCPSGTDGDALVSCRQSRRYPVINYSTSSSTCRTC